VAQATSVIFLRACGPRAELFEKVKRPGLDGHYATAPLMRCSAECPSVCQFFAGLAQVGIAALSKVAARCSIDLSQHHAPLAQSEEQAAGSIPCTEHHFARSFGHEESKPPASSAPVVQSAETRRSDRRWWVFESPSEHQSRVWPNGRGGGFKSRKGSNHRARHAAIAQVAEATAQTRFRAGLWPACGTILRALSSEEERRSYKPKGEIS
jgi:hypothetical protein